MYQVSGAILQNLYMIVIKIYVCVEGFKILNYMYLFWLVYSKVMQTIINEYRDVSAIFNEILYRMIYR